MTVFRVLGDQLVPETEYAAKAPELVRAIGAARSGEDSGPGIMLDHGSPFSFDVETVEGSRDLVGFTPIAFGSPVLVDIRHVYSGSVGAKGGLFGGGSGDIAVVSGVKQWSAFKATARALNWVAAGQGKRTNLPRPNALQDGTPIVAYQKAIATRMLVISVELAAAPKEDDITTLLGRAFTAAAQIPLFLPYAGVLLAAGQVVPAAGKLLKGISRGQSQWIQTEELSFGLAGYDDADAGFRVISSANSGLEKYRYKPGTGLVDSNGQAYAGDEPYVVLAVDGASQSDLEDFTATVTSADMMRRFHMAQDGQGAFVDDLLDLMTIISDVKYRQEAVEQKRRMQDLSGSELTQAQTRYDALVKNIIKTELKP